MEGDASACAVFPLSPLPLPLFTSPATSRSRRRTSEKLLGAVGRREQARDYAFPSFFFFFPFFHPGTMAARLEKECRVDGSTYRQRKTTRRPSPLFFLFPLPLSPLIDVQHYRVRDLERKKGRR